jgi:hypothetical protein
MRGLSQQWTDALAQLGIIQVTLARFEFQSETVCAWTGTHILPVTGTTDPLLNGMVFEPLGNGALVNIGDNSFSYSGSEAMAISLSIPKPVPSTMFNASVEPSEYQTRMAYVWRGIMIQKPNATTPAQWAFQRVRAGAMDELAITNDGEQHTFTLTIEGHASMISAATGSTYLDQQKFDPTDTSQDFAVSIMNNARAPTRSGYGPTNAGGGFGSGDGGGFNLNEHYL